MKIISTLSILLVFSLSSVAQSRVVPVLDLKVGGLLGGVKDGKFVDAKTAFKDLKANSEYTIFSLASGMSQDDLQITVSSPDAPCEDFYWVSTELETKEGVAVGTSAKWKVLPREVKQMSLTDKTYLGIVSGILKAKGLTKSKARIEQAVRVDLDGDGTEEVLISATSYVGNPQPSAKAGDYSFVLLRKIVGGKAQNIIISEQYIKKAIEFGAPTKFEISSVGDLNGDGKMEIIIYDAYYEGSGAIVYEMKGNKPTKVLETGCGV